MCNRILKKENVILTSKKTNTWFLSHKCTRNTRLRVFQWKILHDIYPTNILLSKMKVKENDNCSYCTDTVDVIEHFLLVKCSVVWQV